MPIGATYGIAMLARFAVLHCSLGLQQPRIETSAFERHFCHFSCVDGSLSSPSHRKDVIVHGVPVQAGKVLDYQSQIAIRHVRIQQFEHREVIIAPYPRREGAPQERNRRRKVGSDQGAPSYGYGRWFSIPGTRAARDAYYTAKRPSEKLRTEWSAPKILAEDRAMSQDDDLDPTLAGRFGWHLGTDPTATFFAAERAAVTLFDRHVAEVWDLDPPARAAAMPRLIEALHAIPPLTRFEAVTAVRALRLFAAHWNRLDDAHELVALRLCNQRPLVHPELGDAVVDVARAGNLRLLHALTSSLDDDLELPGIASRLAALGAATSDPAVAELALMLLGACVPAEARPWVQAALRTPVLGLRLASLRVVRRGLAVDDADLRWLLEDAEVHPLAASARTALSGSWFDYEDTLVHVVRAAPPPGGEAPLLRILAREQGYDDPTLPGLSGNWAVRTLAAGWPELAVPAIHAGFRGRRAERIRSILAAAELPAELARPAIERGAADPCREVRSLARLAASSLELLVGAPEVPAVARAWMSAASDRDEAAGPALARWLLAAAPDPTAPRTAADADALSTLIGLVDNYEVARAADLPKGHRAWAERLIAAWGEAGHDALLTAAALEAGEIEGSWTETLVETSRGPRLVPDEVARRIAEDALLSARFYSPEWAMFIVSEAPLGERMAAWAFDELLEGGLRHSTLLLEHMPATDERRERLRAALVAAVAADRTHDVKRLASLASEWADAGCFATLAAAAEAHATVFPAPAWLETGCDAAVEGGLWDAAWIAERLAHPECAEFRLATLALKHDPGEAVIAALEAAFGSDARGGASAAEAAVRLLFDQRLVLSDPRLAAVVHAAPVDARAALLEAIALIASARELEAPAWFAGEVASVLCDPEVVVARRFARVVVRYREDLPLELEEALSRGCDAQVAERLEIALFGGFAADRYWAAGMRHA
jgi:hypothetical protein